MPSDYSFRLSMYLSLSLACGCLGYSEADLLPSGTVIAGLVIGLLIAAFRSEGRFELSLEAANRVGAVLFVAAGVWLTTQLASPGSLIRTVPPPASLLPYIGTMLLVAMPAKLLRPKHAGDWWALQGMGLVAVALACALAEDEVFGVLLALYAVAAIAGLSLFYVRRESGQVAAAPRDPWLVGSVEWLLKRRFGRPAAAPPAVVASAPARVRAAWRPAVGWLGLAVGVALPLFFLTPRSGAARFSVGAQLETGYDSPQMTDLNRTGDLRVNSDVAFEVTVTDADGVPYSGLPLSQRWRGVAFGSYTGGKWDGAALNRIMDYQSQATADQKPAAQRTAPTQRPQLRPGVLAAEFRPRAEQTLRPPLMDPARWEPGAGVPVWTIDRTRRVGGVPWMQKPDGGFNPLVSVQGGREGYVQYVYPSEEGDPDLGTGFDPVEFDIGRPAVGAAGGGLALVSDPVPTTSPAPTLTTLPGGLKELPVRTRTLLDELIAAGKLPRRVTETARFRRDGIPEPADWEYVAAAFRDHLSGGQYDYSLKLRRQDKGSDPIEDFLFRTRAGNCERFAAALVLQCRAVGIPARYVLGFKGHESDGDGRYLLRQDHAHAWTEVLVPRRAATPAGFRWHWLSLDATPDGGSDTEPNDSLLGSAARNGRSFFNQFIIGYNSERRRAAVTTATQAVTAPQFLTGLGGVGVFVVLLGVAWGAIRLVRRRQRRVTPATVGWYARLLDILSAAGHPVSVGQTPAEYARAVGLKLSDELAPLPSAVTSFYYRERYGGSPPSDAEVAIITDVLSRLGTGLPKIR